MDKITLTKREYLGEGYIHIFENIETGNKVYTPFDKETYLKMTGKDGSDFNPEVPEGHKWLGSTGGYIKVNSPTTFLGDGEYTVMDGVYLVARKNEYDSVSIFELTKEEFENKYKE